MTDHISFHAGFRKCCLLGIDLHKIFLEIVTIAIESLDSQNTHNLVTKLTNFLSFHNSRKCKLSFKLKEIYRYTIPLFSFGISNVKQSAQKGIRNQKPQRN